MGKASVSYEEVRDKLLQDPEVKKEYDALKWRYVILSAIAKLRISLT